MLSKFWETTILTTFFNILIYLQYLYWFFRTDQTLALSPLQIYHTYVIVGKTCRQRKHVCAIFQACCAIVLPVDTWVLFFLHFTVKFHITQTPSKVKGWPNMLFNGILCYFEANLELLLLFHFFSWVFVCAIFLAFSNFCNMRYIFGGASLGHKKDNSNETYIQEPNHRKVN